MINSKNQVAIAGGGKEENGDSPQPVAMTLWGFLQGCMSYGVMNPKIGLGRSYSLRRIHLIDDCAAARMLAIITGGNGDVYTQNCWIDAVDRSRSKGGGNIGHDGMVSGAVGKIRSTIKPCVRVNNQGVRAATFGVVIRELVAARIWKNSVIGVLRGRLQDHGPSGSVRCRTEL
jgi:hypothetical protein